MKNRIAIPRQQSLAMPDVHNPFVHRLHLGPLRILQVVVMSLTLAPLRLLLAGLCVVAAWAVAAITLSGCTEEDKKKPLAGWRNTIRPVVVLLSRGVFFMAGFHWISVKGERATPQDAPVIALAPHSTFFDAYAAVYLNLSTIVAKTDSENVPFFGKLIAFTQPVMVKREDPDSRINTIKEIQRRARTKGEWPQILIFPEGTCTNRSCLITFKPGAFYPGVPVQPVCIRYLNKLDTATWTWNGQGAFSCLWLTLCQFHNAVEVEFLPVYKPNDAEKSDAKLFASNLRAVMAKCLGVPTTDHTYDNGHLKKRAVVLNLPMAAGFVEFNKLHKKLGINFNQMRDLLTKFRVIANNSSRHITIEKFSEHLMLPVSDVLHDVFSLYDRDGSGTIDFREYVIGLSLGSGQVNTERTVQLAFQLFDSNNKGHITVAELTQIFHNAFGLTSVDVVGLFRDVDQDKDDKISYDEFKVYALQHPEYAKLFTTYQEKILTNGHPDDKPKAE